MESGERSGESGEQVVTGGICSEDNRSDLTLQAMARLALIEERLLCCRGLDGGKSREALLLVLLIFLLQHRKGWNRTGRSDRDGEEHKFVPYLFIIEM